MEVETRKLLCGNGDCSTIVHSETSPVQRLRFFQCDSINAFSSSVSTPNRQGANGCDSEPRYCRNLSISAGSPSTSTTTSLCQLIMTQLIDGLLRLPRCADAVLALRDQNSTGIIGSSGTTARANLRSTPVSWGESDSRNPTILVERGNSRGPKLTNWYSQYVPNSKK